MFTIKNVTKQYDDEFALQDVSLCLEKGLSFIIGASGSGKTTLLKIMSGMDQNFSGEVSYGDMNIKTISSLDKSYLYNNEFGFIWQDFQLLEDCTVMENVLLPLSLKKTKNMKSVEKVLNSLQILKIADQKVKFLSGGQKQRVAIARELMKNPKVIFADEPTSALDEESAKAIMEVLRVLSKNRTIIIVTHNDALINKDDSIYEFDKGELISKPTVNISKASNIPVHKPLALSIQNAFAIARMNIKNKVGRYAISILTLMISSILLLTTCSGAIKGNAQQQFDQLFNTYGDSLTDINIYKEFMNAAGTDGASSDRPDGKVKQEITGFYDKYANDDRIEFITYLLAFDDIHIQIDGKEQEISSSNNVPIINKLIAGNMPKNDKNEVVIPENIAKEINSSIEKVIGKELIFQGKVTKWVAEEPVFVPVQITVTVVGVMDTTVNYEYEGEVTSYTVDDSFLFSKMALKTMLTPIEMDVEDRSFLMRAKTPESMIAIKDELNAMGIVPTGAFELVEDIVRLNNQTTTQSTSATIIITALSFIIVIAIFLITQLFRKKEVSIYKKCGFTNTHLYKIQSAEMLLTSILVICCILITSPLLNEITKALFNIQILQVTMMLICVGIVILMALVAYITSVLMIHNTSPRKGSNV